MKLERRETTPPRVKLERRSPSPQRQGRIENRARPKANRSRERSRSRSADEDRTNRSYRQDNRADNRKKRLFVLISHFSFSLSI